MANDVAGTDPKPRWVLGSCAAVALGLVGAGIYAAVDALTGTERGFLSLLIAVGVTAGYVGVGRARSLLAAVVSALLTGVLWVVGLLVGQAWLESKDGLSDFPGALQYWFGHPTQYMSAYFDKGAVSYLFAAVTLGGAFFIAFAVGRSPRK